MTNQIDHIVEHLFDKKRLDDVSVYELERFIATHPYFAAGHFLLAKKMLVSEPERYKETIATTALYYNNPLWLQWLLDHDLDSYSKKHEEKELTQAIHEDEGDDEEQSVDTSIPVGKYPVEISIPGEYRETGMTSQVDDPFENNEFTGDTQTISDPHPTFPKHTITNHEVITPIAENDQAITESELEQNAKLVSSQDDITTDLEPEAIKPHRQSNDAIHISKEPDLVNITDHGDEPGEFNQGSSNDDHQAGLGMQNESTDTELNTDHKKAEEESRASAASIGRTLTTAALIPTRAEIEKNEFTFEPYHTIDYFASQGIKLQQSDLSKDKFGKQLKSFTEWLRSMKRLPQVTVETNMDEATRQSIQNIAEHSFEEKDIVTETMAEVWIKQGNKEKAIDTLHKLSLLNPSKSHYFAAKIEQLKAS